MRIGAIAITSVFLGLIVFGLLVSALPVLWPTSQETNSAIWQEFFAYPGIMRSVGISLFAGLGSTFLAFIAAMIICAGLFVRDVQARNMKMLPVALAAPHAAIAIGLTFLLAPSGFVFRVIAQIFDHERPLGLPIMPDAYGVGLLMGLFLKELPFLLIIVLVTQQNLGLRKHYHLGLSLGYPPISAWFTCIAPQIYPRMRLAVYVVLAYALSVVDMAKILAPNAPSPLAVVVQNWHHDPSLQAEQLAAVGVVMQFLLVWGGFVLWWLGERACKHLYYLWVVQGWRGRRVHGVLLRVSIILDWFWKLTTLAALLILILWAFAWRWRFPDIMPQDMGLNMWVRHGGDILVTILTSVIIAMFCIAIAFCVLLIILEDGLVGQSSLLLPLLLPQVAFLFGVQSLFVTLNIDATLWAVIFMHGFFVIPYMYLALAGSWHALDPRMIILASTLGAGPWRIVWQVKIPMVKHVIALSLAVGFAVSIAEYLPTLVAGVGRVETLATQAVALAGQQDYRMAGILAMLQAILPMMGFMILLLLGHKQEGRQ
ncbi:MAG: hypothetical protein AAF352_01265 [Pseudomonadota bacterium]